MLVWVAFGLWVLINRRWKVLAGSVACVMGASAATLIANPRVFSQYFELMSSAPPTLTFESPNIASLLRAILHTRGSWPQYVPSVLGAAAVIELWRRHNDDWDWRRYLPGLVLFSCLVTSYGGWAFDLVVLLVPIAPSQPRWQEGRANPWQSQAARCSWSSPPWRLRCTRRRWLRRRSSG